MQAHYNSIHGRCDMAKTFKGVVIEGVATIDEYGHISSLEGRVTIAQVARELIKTLSAISKTKKISFGSITYLHNVGVEFDREDTRLNMTDFLMYEIIQDIFTNPDSLYKE